MICLCTTFILFYFKIPLVANFESEITCLTMTGNFYKIFSYHMLPAKTVPWQQAKFPAETHLLVFKCHR